MLVTATAIPEVLRLEPRRFRDARGFFAESWNSLLMREAGIDIDFVQDNQSFSLRAGTVRGLHCQVPPMAQTKLVRVARGAIRDVAVDIREGSPTFGRWVAETLSAENGRQLLVPKGFLHGFVTLEPETEVIYKVDAHYAPDCDRAVRFDDPALGIDWGIAPGSAVLSDKDAAAPAFDAFRNPFRYEEPVA